MISLRDNIKVGHKIEKVYDVINRAPFSLKEEYRSDVNIVSTNLGEIAVTDDTYLMLADGTYKRVDKLKPYTDSLKVNGDIGVVCSITHIINVVIMAAVSDTDYVTVNGFTVAPDM